MNEEDYPDARDFEVEYRARRSHYRQNRKSRRDAEKGGKA